MTEYSAWGEWDMEKYREMIGYIPDGIKNAKTITPVIPDYGEGSVLLYYLSGVVGVVLLYGILYLLSRKKNVTN